jgi:L-alanine-DL-glutamate epimerase-like enolase superfamily enzyme
MKIERVTVCPVKLPRKESFGVRTGAYDVMPNVYVRIDTDDGVVGYGEGAPIEDYFGETQKSITTAVSDYFAPVLLGKDPLRINTIMDELDRVLPGQPCAKAAIDIALHDLKGKALGVPIAELLGGRFADEVPLTVSVGIDEPGKMNAKIRAAADAGFPIIKLKGGEQVEDDVAALRRAREAIGDGGPWLRLDANAGYRNPHEIWRYARELEELRVALFEQPFAAHCWDAHRMLRDRMNVPILLDESMQTGADLREIAKSPEGFVANIKLQKSGGFLRASKLVYAAAQFGIPVMIGSQRESVIGNTASIHLAALVSPMDYTCDQRYALALRDEANVVTNAPDVSKPTVAVPTGAGLGLEIDWQMAERLSGQALPVAA